MYTCRRNTSIPTYYSPAAVILTPHLISSTHTHTNHHLLVLPLFHNVNHFNIFHIHIDVNEFRHIHLSRFINININMGNVRMTYIVKRRKYQLSHNFPIFPRSKCSQIARYRCRRTFCTIRWNNHYCLTEHPACTFTSVLFFFFTLPTQH